MAYNKRLNLTDIFPNADYNTTTSTFEIPLTDLTSGGLDSTEATAEDARKLIMAILKVATDTQATILADYTASQALAEYTEAVTYAQGDKVLYNGVEYEALNAIASAPATFNSSDWQENDLLQPCDNFGTVAGNVFFTADGTSGTQRFSIDVTYSSEFDIKDE